MTLVVDYTLPAGMWEGDDADILADEQRALYNNVDIVATMVKNEDLRSIDIEFIPDYRPMPGQEQF